jgi:signal transduction histidine kinase
MGCTELLGEKVKDRPELRRLTDMAMGAAERGSDLTRSLLAFSRRQPLEPQLVDLESLTREFAPPVTRSLGETIWFVIFVEDPLWPVRLDASQYESAILNLAVNAGYAMPEGGTLSIRVTNTEVDAAEIADLHDARPGPHVVVEVADTGKGMRPEVLERVFEPFFTTKEKKNNSGLGLSMVFGFLAQCSGFVRIASTVDKGTTITLYFPRAETEPTATAD